MGFYGPLPRNNVRRRNKRPPPAGRALVARPALPKDLTGEARAEWRRIVPELLAAGLLSKLDRGILIRYCQTWADWVELDTALQASSKLVRGARTGDVIRSPLWRMRNEADTILLELGRQLGLTPVSRIRAGVKHEPPAVQEQDGGPVVLDMYRRLLSAADDD